MDCLACLTAPSAPLAFSPCAKLRPRHARQSRCTMLAAMCSPTGDTSCVHAMLPTTEWSASAAVIDPIASWSTLRKSAQVCLTASLQRTPSLCVCAACVRARHKRASMWGAARVCGCRVRTRGKCTCVRCVRRSRRGLCDSRPIDRVPCLLIFVKHAKFLEYSECRYAYCSSMFHSFLYQVPSTASADRPAGEIERQQPRRASRTCRAASAEGAPLRSPAC